MTISYSYNDAATNLKLCCNSKLAYYHPRDATVTSCGKPQNILNSQLDTQKLHCDQPQTKPKIFLNLTRLSSYVIGKTVSAQGQNLFKNFFLQKKSLISYIFLPHLFKNFKS